MHQLRRLALALAVSVVAAGGAALMARSAVSSPAAPGAPQAAATEEPNQQQQPDQQAPNTGGPSLQKPSGLLTKIPSGITKSGTKTLTKTKTPTKSVTKTPTKTPTKSKTTSKSPTKSRTTTKPPSSGGTQGSGGVPVVPGGGGAGAACSNRTTSPVTLQVGSVGGKEALVDGDGCAVYVNTQDTQDATACDSACEAQWPPLHAPGQAGDGVTQDTLATFARPSGVQQVNFFGHQLYYFTGDTAPGQANGQGVNQTWYLVDRSGNPITQ